LRGRATNPDESTIVEDGKVGDRIKLKKADMTGAKIPPLPLSRCPSMVVVGIKE